MVKKEAFPMSVRNYQKILHEAARFKGRPGESGWLRGNSYSLSLYPMEKDRDCVFYVGCLTRPIGHPIDGVKFYVSTPEKTIEGKADKFGVFKFSVAISSGSFIFGFTKPDFDRSMEPEQTHLEQQVSTRWLSKEFRRRLASSFEGGLAAGVADDSTERTAKIVFEMMNPKTREISATLSLYLSLEPGNDIALYLDVLRGRVSEPVKIRAPGGEWYTLDYRDGTPESLPALFVEREDLIKLLEAEVPWVIEDASGSLGIATIAKREG